MQYLSKRVAHLRGLADGLGIDGTTKEGKLFGAIIDLLDDIADTISYLEDDSFNLNAEFSADGSNDYICPNCNEAIEMDENLLKENMRISCPKCEGTIFVLCESSNELQNSDPQNNG